MRRSLIITVGAAVSMVLLAMLIPMAVLVRSYALEDRLARAALEVQATETVVSRDKGAVSVYLDQANNGDGIVTTVLYPDGTSIGPTPGEDERVVEARATGQARVDGTDDGAEILVPVSLGGSSTLPELTPVIRVEVKEPLFGSGVLGAWLVLAGLGLVLLLGALVLADRLGRSFVRPIGRLAAHAEHLGDSPTSEPVALEGPPEIRELGAALNRLVARIEVLLERERRGVSDLSHRLRTPITALRLRVDGPDAPDMARLSRDLDELEQMVDHVVREARRSEREGLVPEADALLALGERTRFWSPLAEDQARAFQLDVPGPTEGPILVCSSEADLVALLDVLMDNVFSHTPEGAPVKVSVKTAPGGGAILVVEDGGPGFPEGMQVADRGTSGVGSTGLGLSIVAATAEESGGRLQVGRSAELGGARVEVLLGPPA